MRTTTGMLMMVGMLAGCASQQPAPVIGGYGQLYNQQAATVSAFDTVEPAAGPLVASTTPVADPVAAPMLAASKPPVQVANVPKIAPEATLPPPSILGDMTRKGSDVKGWHSYKVQRGDTAYRLASQFDTSTPAILAANNLDNVTEIKEGQVLMIPAGAGRFATAESIGKKMKEVAQVEVAEPIAEVAAVDTKPTVVKGPNGTRYSLTNSVAADKPVQVASAKVTALEDVEPAAGPVKTVSKAVKEDASLATTSYKVMPGDTVYRIASRYNVSVMDILNANDLDNPQDLKAGSTLRVPVTSGVVKSPAKVSVAKDESAERLASLKGKIDPAAARTKGLAWPVKGKVVRSYGEQGAGVANSGISIKTSPNSPVVAAEAGTVVYAGNSLKTYGNLVLLRHKNGLVTAYAHNNALLVTKGETVKKGQTIALSGNTGNVKEPELHFEVRRNAQAVDPLSMLP